MEDWIRHTYRRSDRRLSVKEGAATLKNSVEDAEPVNPVAIAGFTRPLPRQVEVVPPAPDWIEVIEIDDDPFGLKG